MQSVITREHIAAGMSYPQYMHLIEQLLVEGKTTGSDHSPKKIGYTELNLYRMKRLNKTITLMPELEDALVAIEEPVIWVVLVEAWCGDGAQMLPAIARMAEQATNVELKILLRDAHPEVMDAYLTNGGRSIPKLICLKADTLEELSTWGPRPAHAQAMVAEFKANPGERTYQDFQKELQAWYTRDCTHAQQQELLALLSTCCSHAIA